MELKKNSRASQYSSFDEFSSQRAFAPCSPIEDLGSKRVMLSSGRLLLFTYAAAAWLFYSDDNGVTWSNPVEIDLTVEGATFIGDNKIGAVYATGGIVYFQKSNDNGFTWSSAVIVASDANTQRYPNITTNKNGDLVCVYSSDEDSVADFGIKAKRSTDGGVTWSSSIDVIDYDAEDLEYPDIIRDINGTLIVACRKCVANSDIAMSFSTDDGLTWLTAGQLLKSTGATDLAGPKLTLVNGHIIFCVYEDVTNSNIDCVRRGMWEAYSANACPCAIDIIEQKLICDVGVEWHGGGGVAGDKWQFEAEFVYAMSNLISHGSQKPWRSEQDNIACNIVIDMGTNERFFADGVAFFNANVRTLDFQMNATDSWGSPSVDESVSFDVATGTVDSVAGNYIEDSSLMASYKDHEYKRGRYFIRMTSGTDDGATWMILDNVGDYIVLDTTSATNIAATDTFVIFKERVSKTFTAGVYRFMRIAISAQHTADDYYQLGAALMGTAVTLSDGFGMGYKRSRQYDTVMLRSLAGDMIPILGHSPKEIFYLTWRANTDTRDEILALLDYIEGKNIVLIPDTSDMTDCYLVKHIGNAESTHRFLNRFDFGAIVFEEV